MPTPQVEHTMTIHRVDADPLRFKLRRTADEIRNAGSAIENGLAANHLGVVLGESWSSCRRIRLPGLRSNRLRKS